MSPEIQLWISLGYGVFMLLLALFFRRKPPAKINHLYGYRTKRSMKNQATWKAGNDYSARMFVQMSWALLILPPLLYVLYPQWILLLTIGVQLVLLICLMIFTEKYLKQRFDQDGHPIE
ncbi:MAG: SdpI family protein [Bacteroidota bacterium]